MIILRRAINRSNSNDFFSGGWRAFHRFLCLTALTACLCGNTAFAQQDHIVFEKLSLEHGLSQTTVSAIIQDRDGFMWFGSRNGLNQYDGYQFKVFKNIAFDSSSLSDNWIMSLCIDRNGHLWIGTLNRGLNRYDPLSGVFHHYDTKGMPSLTLPNNRVQALTVDLKGHVWIGTVKGLSRYDGNTFYHYFNDPGDGSSISDNYITSLAVDPNGILWIGTRRGLNRYDGTVFTHIRHDPANPASLSEDIITALTVDSSGFVWAGTESGGLNRLSINDRSYAVKRYVKSASNSQWLSHNEILALYTDRTGCVWVGTRKGLNQYCRITDSFTKYLNNKDDAGSISNDEIRSIYQDRSGILWIGTYGGGGINKLDLKKPKFVHYHFSPKITGSLSDDVVRTFFKDRSGRLWIGTHAGLNRYDAQTHSFISYQQNPLDPFSISNNEIRAIIDDRDGNLWIGTEGGLNRMSIDADGRLRFTAFRANPEDPNSLSDNKVFTIYQDKDDYLWLGTNGGGLNRFDKETRTFRRFLHDPLNPHSISSDYISVVYGTREGVIWIGTFGGGLNKMVRNEKGRETFVVYQNDPRNTKTISSDVIYSILEDKQGTLWIGTNTGLNRFNKSDETFENISEKDGLPDSYIYGILEDDHGYLWLSSVGGLTKYDPVTKKVRNYDIRDRLQSNEFKYGSYYKARDGEMFFGGVNGFNSFYPDRVQDNPYQPPVVLTAFQRTNGAGLHLEDQIMLRNQRIQINYGENFLFEFSALDYSCPSKNLYAYRLRGYDRDWIQAGHRRTANYTNLDGGTYLFEVRGSNADGVWSDQTASVEVYIRPPFWQTWPFRILVLAGLILTALAVYEWRVRSIRRRNEELERKVGERTKALRDTQYQLIQSEKISAVGRMVAGITHEINNPLAFVIGNLSMFEEYVERLRTIIRAFEKIISERIADSDSLIRQIRDTHDYEDLITDAQASIKSCGNGAERIKKIIMNLRTFSMLNERDLMLSNINTELHNAVLQMKEKAGDRVRLIEQYGDLPMIDCFPGLLNLVFVNIITNAIEAIPQYGDVFIHTDVHPDLYIQIRIRDTGVGITPDRIGKIFDPFFTTKEIGQGTGLGLSISYGIIKTHKGDIRVWSEPGKGTEFTILLPLTTLRDDETSQPENN